MKVWVNTKNTSEIIGNTIYDMKNLIQIQNENGSGSMSDNQRTYTILIVDNDVEMGQMLKTRLKGGGITSNGPTTVSKLLKS